MYKNVKLKNKSKKEKTMMKEKYVWTPE